ncbi:hypothetical protein BJ138DRAFT_1205594 [Hygrophoropsis aurantiaca]|uniref:Uncharacterized protein n=1 Tax=Hygrophoropsis aurantiaca TaxID=72124 RepID=A0ACB8AMA9_9AGAM|nr:hypothetical protein BJ138DRAFT_1205594 [Hygrophoropsis aurantiaca]
MSRIPPALLYLTIYNPTLRPTNPVDQDDEDAEEQAHILFYTARERAVSRDRMLRQVGLAKALINFSEMFNPEDPCQNVHSQTKRMVMVNPEPDFWIHAAIEAAKTPRLPLPKGKGKDKEKSKGKDKQQDKQDGADSQTIYEYHDGALHDYALRAHLLRGYEHFKLIHGSFTSILSSIGQQALELQLERFFTIWAWVWDLENGYDLGVDLGLPLHPLHHSVLPLIDIFTSHIPENITPLILSPPNVIPSIRYKDSNYSPALARHLLSLAQPYSKDKISPLSESMLSHSSRNATSGTDKVRSNGAVHASSGFLGIPVVNLNMDVRKWSWPGALTFGKNPHAKPKSSNEAQIMEKSIGPDETITEIDKMALEDAISSGLQENYSIGIEPGPHEIRDQPPASPSKSSVEDGQDERYSSQDVDTPKTSRVPSPVGSPSNASPRISTFNAFPSHDSMTAPIPDFSSIHVFLADKDNPSETRRSKVLYMQKDSYTLALVGIFGDSEPDTVGLRQLSAQLLQDVDDAISEEVKRELESSLPSATKILQPKDNHLISKSRFTLSSQGFIAKSEHLYNGKQLLERELDILEVYCRGQNPQHWQVVSRSSGTDDVDDTGVEVYLEVSRKEASLADVGNDIQKLHRSQP